MASSSSSRTGIDMNDPATLSLYNQLFLFKHDDSKDSFEWNDPSNQLQGTLHQLADCLDLQYEFSLSTGVVRISRQNSLPITESDLFFLDHMDSESLINFENALDKILKTNPATPDANSASIGTFAFNPESNSQTLDSWPLKGNNNELFLTCLDGDSSNPHGYQASNGDSFRVGMPENSTPDVMQFAEGSNLLSRHDLDGVQQGAAADMLALDLDSQMQDVTDFDAQQGPTPASEIMPTPASLLLGASRTSDVTRKRKQTEAIDAPNYFSLPRRTSSNAASSISSFNSSHGSSRSGSVNSAQSKRHQSTFQGMFRRESMHSGSSYGSQERVMDWSSELSGSQVSLASGRRGPLDDAARAARNAVKKVKACWRCKFMKKKCSPENPCAFCQKGQKPTPWVDVPCCRGAIKNEMVPIVLCPAHQSPLKDFRPESDLGTIVLPNIYLRETRQKRIEHLMHLGSFAFIFCKDRNTWPLNWPLSDYYQHFPVECFRGSHYSYLKSDSAPAAVPLNECILDLIWEILGTQSSKAMVEECFGIENFVSLCVSAASYQAKLEHDKLIAQSFLWLRYCLEAVRAQQSGFLEESCHKACRIGKCNIDCLNDIYSNIKRYLDEVSRVILERDTTHKNKSWWLSMFYSVCLQNFVRKSLLQLPSYRLEACQQYLHLPVRLFVAMSSTFDPLIRPPVSDTSSLEEETPSEGDFISARFAVNRAKWGQVGIRNSGEYLKRLLEDEGATLLRRQDISDDSGHRPYEEMATRKALHDTNTSHADKRGAGFGKLVEYFANQFHVLDDELS